MRKCFIFYHLRRVSFNNGLPKMYLQEIWRILFGRPCYYLQYQRSNINKAYGGQGLQVVILYFESIYGVYNYRNSLTFVLQFMEAIIILQIEMFYEFCLEKNEVPDYMEDIKLKLWNTVDDKAELGEVF